MGEEFARIASGGPIVAAVAVAALAGLVSILSPCVLPLLPGYLSYVTGLAGADLADALDRPVATRGRILLGTGGFVAGFTAVFAVTGVVAASAGRALKTNAHLLEVGVGVAVIVLGLAFLGLVPGLWREYRPRWLPSAGTAGAPLLGAVFALSWLPCVGPTLAAVLGLAMVDGSTARALTLTVAYCLGLGLPFVAFGLGFRRLIGVHRALRRHNVWVTRVGGGMLILVGLALVTGGWEPFVIWLRVRFGPGSVLL